MSALCDFEFLKCLFPFGRKCDLLFLGEEPDGLFVKVPELRVSYSQIYASILTYVWN